MMRQLEKLKKLESHNFLSIYECYIIYKFNLRQIQFFLGFLIINVLIFLSMTLDRLLHKKGRY